MENKNTNVYKEIGFENPEIYELKSELCYKINQIIKHRRLKQAQAAKILCVDQPKISALNRGRLDGFSIGKLIIFLHKLDYDVKFVISKKHAF